MNSLPLTAGATGEAVGDLHRRLVIAGYDPGRDDPGRFTLATEQAVRAFQADRGLVPSGTVDASTWQTLLEAGYQLGDRVLYHRMPMQRGDDVAGLQQRLGSLGFDAGRVDGIFGPQTAGALAEFQRNCGLPVDGVFGHDTLVMLQRVGGRPGSELGVAAVRERESLLDGRDPMLLRVAVGHSLELATVGRAVTRGARKTGATVVVLDDPDWSVQAQAANRFGAHVFLGLVVGDGRPGIMYYETPGFSSVGGRRLADLLHDDLGIAHCFDAPRGMRLPILRETRMPAVVMDLGSVRSALHLAPRIAQAVARTLTTWSTPLDSAPGGSEGARGVPGGRPEGRCHSR